MKKKLLALVLVVVMAATAVVGGTMAYLTDEDSDVNVMTLGNVSIELIEQQRSNGPDSDLEPFEDDKALYPIVGSAQGEKDKWGMPTAANYVDKIVSVKNTGVSEAYIRVLVAVPAALESDEASKNALHWNLGNRFDVERKGTYNTEGSQPDYDYVIKTEAQAEKDGIIYNVYSFTYNTALTPGDTFDATIIGFYLDENLDNENGKYVLNGNVIDYDISKGVQIPVMAQAIQTAGFATAAAAFEASGMTTNPWNGIGAADTWDGTADTSWYNDTDTEFTLTTAEQLAGLAELVDGGNTFAGKTVKLGGNMDLDNKLFDPIGSYRSDLSFKGTFDGQGNTIMNLSQNTWELDNGYYYSDLGLGLFGKVQDATVKNLTMDGANISGESALSGIVAAAAYGTCTFENITVTNSQAADYQYYSGGIVAWASGDHQYINCDVDASTTIAAQWGDFDNSTGGIIGGASGSATIYLKDCDVACRIDAYNDVTSTYQWYAYRRCGMLIGNTQKTATNESGTTVAAAPQLTCENVTVTYGDWANYTYCEFADTNWPYVRVQAGVSNSAYSNPRYGHPTDANGNEVVDDNHVHNEGEDHFIECTFDQLYGGGQGVYGTATHDGVTVIYNNK